MATRKALSVCWVMISSIWVQESGRSPRATTLICTGNDSRICTSMLLTIAWPRTVSVEMKVDSTVGPTVGVAAVSPAEPLHAARAMSAHTRTAIRPSRNLETGFAGFFLLILFLL